MAYFDAGNRSLIEVPEAAADASPRPSPEPDTATDCSFWVASSASALFSSKIHINRSIRDGEGKGREIDAEFTFQEIGVEVGGVAAEPGFALFEVRPELAVLRGKAADAAVEDTHRPRLLRHHSFSPSCRWM